MKASEIAKIRDMNDAELQKRLKELKEELFNLRFQHAINQLDNPMRLKAELFNLRFQHAINQLENPGRIEAVKIGRAHV